jgi:hypothetical protein
LEHSNRIHHVEAEFPEDPPQSVFEHICSGRARNLVSLKLGYSGPEGLGLEVFSDTRHIHFKKLEALELTNIHGAIFRYLNNLTSVRLVRSRDSIGSAAVSIKSFFDLLSNSPGLQSLALVRYLLKRTEDDKEQKGPPIPLHSLTRVSFIYTNTASRSVLAHIDAPAIDSLVVCGIFSGSFASFSDPTVSEHLPTLHFTTNFESLIITKGFDSSRQENDYSEAGPRSLLVQMPRNKYAFLTTISAVSALSLHNIKFLTLGCTCDKSTTTDPDTSQKMKAFFGNLSALETLKVMSSSWYPILQGLNSTNPVPCQRLKTVSTAINQRRILQCSSCLRRFLSRGRLLELGICILALYLALKMHTC